MSPSLERSRPIVNLAYRVITERTVFIVVIFVGKRVRFAWSALTFPQGNNGWCKPSDWPQGHSVRLKMARFVKWPWDKYFKVVSSSSWVCGVKKDNARNSAYNQAKLAFIMQLLLFFYGRWVGWKENRVTGPSAKNVRSSLERLLLL